MARQQGTLVLNGEGYANQSFAPVVDLRQGGQHGFIPDYTTFLSNSAYVQRNVIPFLIEYPRGFDYMPEPHIWIGTLKALVETQAKSIEGLQGAITVNYVSNPFGAAGEEQEDYSQTQRARSTPTFSYVERQGRPVYHFYNGWIFYLLGHPDTQTPMINSIHPDKHFDFLPDFNSMTVLFVEPDPFQRRVEEAWLCLNMKPKGSGPLEGKRDLPSAMQSREVSIEFTAITMMSLGVKQLGQSLLDQMNYASLNPQTRLAAVEEISANIRDAQTSGGSRIGYLHQTDDVATNQRLDNTKLNPQPQRNVAWELSQSN